ncbi:MAG TPA: cytochrome c3 family protein [Syntrophobacteraceae bacterium]|nr:cytochrome c3 family protein [Syntrophobacteraceae bacterium]
MARGSIIGVLMIVLIGLLMWTGRVGAQPETIVLEHKDVFKELQRPAVKFNHEVHAGAYPDCVECHHVYETKGGKKVNVWSGEGQPCSECHKIEDSGKIPALREAFHENCTGCHRKLAQGGKKTGPVMCGECHVWPKAAK